MRNAFVNTILDATHTRDDVFIISGDAGLGVFDDFHRNHPERFLNLGVAEQNMISVAAGMALTGYKVYVYNIIPFVLYRCYEQVRNDICYQELPITLIGIGSGITYAPQGMTHYSVEDLGLAGTMPNLEVFSPIDPIEARLAAQHTLNSKSPCYVRLAKRGEPDLHPTSELDITRPLLLKDGREVALIFHGSIGEETLRAAELLRQEGLAPRLLSLPRVQPIDWDALDQALRDIKHVFVVEEHFTSCGLGAVIMREWARSPRPWRVHSLGIADTYIHDIKHTASMRDHFGISAPKIAAHVREVLGGAV
ncbi:MAG: transketolase C-terminal domain-containing protein [Sulfuricella sp.]